MLSKFWCSAVKEEAWDLIKDKFDTLKKSVDRDFVKNFNDTGKKLLKLALDHYDSNTKSYDLEIRKGIWEDLSKMIYDDLERLYKI